MTWSTILFFFTDWVLRIGVTLHILMRRRPLPVTLTWTMIVLLTPVLGIILYILFGELRLGADRLIWKKRFTNVLFERAVAILGERGVLTAPTADAPIASFIAQSTGLPPVHNNRLELLNTSDAFLTRLAADIDSAQQTVSLQTYIWHVTPKTRIVADALIRAARRGVACRVLIDGHGGRPFLRSSLPRELRDGGVRVVATLPARLWSLIFRRLDVRNHRKIAVIDSRVAYCGSHNLTDETFGTGTPKSCGPWIDASVRLVGPAAQLLQLVFLRDWEFDAEEPTREIEPFLPELPAGPESGALVQVVAAGPGIAERVFEEALLTAIYGARREILMCCPYFVPDDALLTAIRSAAERGIDVRLVIPLRNDSLLVGAASIATFGDLLKSGVKIYRYQPCLLHSKVIMVDDRAVAIGSSNLDMRSFHINFEVMLMIYDQAFAQRTQKLFDDYQAQSRPFTQEDWDRVTFLQRLGYNVANLAGQIL